MRRITGWFLAGLFLAGLLLAALASPAIAQPPPYDRYERGYPAGPPPPPPRGAPPPPPRGVPPPPPRHALHSQPYFFGHIGFFEPNDDFDGLEGYDSGGAFDIGIGARVSPILAVDGTFGGYAAEVGPNEVTVLPLTVGLRLVFPNPFIEPYIGGGVGLYFADLEEPFSGIGGIDDSDTTVGAYASFGVDMWLSPHIALSLEGKYHWAEPTFTDASGIEFDVDVSGWTGTLGIRVAF